MTRVIDTDPCGSFASSPGERGKWYRIDSGGEESYRGDKVIDSIEIVQ